MDGSLRKDHVSAVVLIAMGIAIVVTGSRYPMGSLVNMGPAFIPVVLGTIMMVVGAALGLLAKTRTPEERAEQTLSPLPDFRGVACILAGSATFISLANYGGLIPATFISVFIAALGDRNNTWKSAALLGLSMVVFGVLVFHLALKVQLPLFGWGG
jgi:hypothetical protein